MNIDNQIIMQIKGGYLPPDDLLQHLLAKLKPNTFGCAIQNSYVPDGEKDAVPDLAIIKEDAPEFDDIKRVLVNAKKEGNFPVTMWLGSLNSKYNPDDIQPYVLEDPETKEAFIALFLEGTLVGHDDPKDRIEQYNYINGILMPKINDFCHAVEGDFAKIDAFLRKDSFNKEFLMHVGHRAVLQIVPKVGDPVPFGKNKLGGEPFEWGWVSQLMGYGDAKVQEPEVKKSLVATAAARFGGGWGKKTTSVPSTQPVRPPEQPGVHVSPPPTKPDESPEIVAAKSSGSYPAKRENRAPTILAKPPEWARQKNDVTRLWYDIVGNLPTGQMNNVLPAAWKKYIVQPILDQKAVAIDNLDEFMAYAMQRKLLAGDRTTETAAGKPPASTAAADVKHIANDLPILNKETLEKVLEFVATLDTSSKSIKAPKDIQAMEEALPNFAKAVGLDESETLNWPVHALAKIAEVDPMALVCYAVMWRNKWRALKTQQLEAGAKGNKTVVETEKSITTVEQRGDTKITSSISKENPPVPKKASGGGWGRKAA